MFTETGVCVSGAVILALFIFQQKKKVVKLLKGNVCMCVCTMKDIPYKPYIIEKHIRNPRIHITCSKYANDFTKTH